MLVGTGTDGFDTRHGTGVGRFFGSRKGLAGLNFLQNGHIGYASYLEYGEGNVFGAVRFLNGGQYFVAGMVVAMVAALTLHRVVEDGTDVVFA